MGIGKKMTKGMMGGGVNISHKETMGGKAKSLMSYPGGMPGKQDSNGVVGKGMMQYLSGEPVGMGKYKHSSMPMYGKEKGMPDYSKGPEKELIGNQNKLPEELKKKIEAAPPKYNKNDYGISPLSGKPYAKSVSDEQKAKDLAKANKIKKEKKGGPAKKVLLTVREEKAKADAEKKKQVGKKKSNLTLGKTTVGKTFEKAGGDLKFDKVDLSKSSGKKSMSDVEKIKASKAKKQASGEKKASDAAKELKAAKESKFISRGSGEDSDVETRQGRRKKIRAARKKGREGRREVRKSKRKTIIKQKI
jgi:hypothetical protein